MLFTRRKPIQRRYVSEIDQFLQAFDKKPEAHSLSRRAEEAKYEWINKARNNPKVKKPSSSIWD